MILKSTVKQGYKSDRAAVNSKLIYPSNTQTVIANADICWGTVTGA